MNGVAIERVQLANSRGKIDRVSLLEILKLAEECGLGFVLGGELGGVYEVSAEDAEKFIYANDDVEFWSAYHNCSREEISEFIENEGRVRCMARTRKGRRCSLSVSGLHKYLDVSEWVVEARNGGYCSFHGGNT